MDWNKLLSDERLRKSRRTDTSRNNFESDFGRTIFSPATRRMHDKTQVFPLTADDHIHTRLTHSMEVMAIGHSLGIKVCEDSTFRELVGVDRDIFREIPVILKNACLLHDIGNPPFGHFGENVIQNYFAEYFKSKEAIDLTTAEKEDFMFFDGNAQGFRVITKLQILNDPYGLNLTYATLGAYLKYPNAGAKDKSKIYKKKRGIFQSEIEYLNKVAEGCGTKIDNDIIRHPLCYLMEAADSICYLVMDIEDGFNKGWYNFNYIANKLSKVDGIAEAVKKTESKRNGFGDESTMMVNFRIYLINRLVNLAVKNFLDNIEQICAGLYFTELINDDETKLTEALIDFTCEEIFPKREITSLELTGHSVLTGLLDYYIKFIFHKEESYQKRAAGLISDSVLRIAFIENKESIFVKRLKEFEAKSKIDDKNKIKYQKKYENLNTLLDKLNELKEETSKNQILNEDIMKCEAEIIKLINPHINDLNNYYKLRVIVDFISGMTDQFALNHYQKLSGQKIS